MEAVVISELLVAVGFTAALTLVGAVCAVALSALIKVLYRHSPRVRRFFDAIQFD